MDHRSYYQHHTLRRMQSASGLWNADGPGYRTHSHANTYAAFPTMSGGRFETPASSAQGSATRRMEKRKTVHWAANVVDNEFKMQSRPNLPPVAKSASQTSKGSSSWSEPTPSGSTSSSKGYHVNPSSERSTSYSNQQRTQVPSQSNWSSSTAPITSNQRRTQVSASTASIPSRRTQPSPRQWPPVTTTVLPPLVPDVPWTQRPPPAPRPSRLPTPELPEISAGRFFAINQPRESHGSRERRGIINVNVQGK